MTTSGPADLNIAHQGSGHVAPGPPSPSGGPAPTPSGQWVPAPYMYISRSQTLHPASGGGDRTLFGEHKACVQDSYMDVDEPANLPAKPGEKQPTGADLSNQAIIGVAQIATATGRAYSKAKKFAVTGNAVKLCLPGENAGSIHLANGVLVDAGAPGMTFDKMSQDAAVVTQSGDPVNVVSGEVIDDVTDLFLPGKIVVELRRLYGSDRHRETSPFGVGGFTHNFDQWVEVDRAGGRTLVRTDEGRDLAFPLLEPRSSSFRRQKRLTLTRGSNEYIVYDHDTRLFRDFAPLVPGGKAMLRAVRDAWQNRVELVYEDGRLARLIDTAAREIRFFCDQEGRLVRLEVWAPERFTGKVPEAFAMQQFVDYAYTEDGELASATDALGYAEHYAYDGRHRLVRKTLKNGLHFDYTYEGERGRCVRSTADGNVQNIELYYDDRKRSTKVHGTPEPREFIHDEKGLVILKRTLDGTVEEALVVDRDQYVLERRNAAGEVTTYEHDEHGHTTKISRADGTEVLWEYVDDLLVKRVDPGQRVTKLEVDARGAVVRWTDPSGHFHAYDIDAHGRITAVADAAGTLLAVVFDEQHNVVRETDARAAVTTCAYDPMGRMTRKTDALGRSRTFAYDVLGRPVRETMPDGTVLTYDWDAMGNVIRTSDGTTESLIAYAGTGKVARRVMADGTAWEYGYDIAERVREVRNPKQELYRFQYDRAGRVTEARAFDGQVVKYRYSTGDVLSRVEYMDDTWIEFANDGMGRRIAEMTPHGAVTYERNDVGWITRAVVSEYYGQIVSEIAYDADGRILSYAVDGKKVDYEYAPTGELVSRKLPNGQITRYAYDAAGALIAIEHEGAKVLLERDILGREMRRQVARSGVDMVFRWSEDDRLAGLAVAAPSGSSPRTLIERAWRYGPHARIAFVSDARWGPSERTHDALGRLTGFCRGSAWERYEYDAAGYLEAIHRPSGGDATGRWTLRTGNLLLRTEEARYEYDDRRRRRRKIRVRNGQPAGDVTEYLWDAHGRLREVHVPEGEQVHFAYDAFGRLVRKVIVAPPDPERPADAPRMRFVDYVWDGDELALLLTSEGNETVFVHEPRTFFPILQREGEKTFLYVTDPLGVPTELLAEDGRIVAAWRYTPWGRLEESYEDELAPKPVHTPFRLLGQVFHPEVGLASTRHRWFDADTARWLTPDPLGIAGGPDLFGFDGSPTERVDPLGLYTASSFQQFLNDTNKPRIDANNAAALKQSGGVPNGPNKCGPGIAASAVPIPGRTGQAKAATAMSSGANTLPGHAERNPLRKKQGLEASETESAVGAIGAGKPHCGNCTNAIINTQGAVTASTIRGVYTDRDGNPKNEGGFQIPSPTKPGGFDPEPAGGGGG